MDFLSVPLLHLVPSSQHGCSSDMLNTQPSPPSLPVGSSGADSSRPRDPEDDWHGGVRGGISVICISSDYRL